MEFRLLGSFEVWDGDEPVEIAGSKRRALLALLVLRANEVVRSERLIEELWGERPPRNAAAALHSHVSRLRKALGPEVLARRQWGYVLRSAPETIDLRCFEDLLAQAEPLPARERSTKLAEALAFWRGQPLADLVLEPALQGEIARLEELHLTTLERRIDADLEAGRNSELVGELEALIAQNPMREHLRWQLILSLYRAGRQAEALEVYRETRRVLAEELGLDPSPALRELERAILRQDPSLGLTPTPAPAEPPAPPPQRSRRRVLPFALLALLALGAGAAAAVALVRSNGSTVRPRAQAPVGRTGSTATSSPRSHRPVVPARRVRKRARQPTTLRPTNRKPTHARTTSAPPKAATATREAATQPVAVHPTAAAPVPKTAAPKPPSRKKPTAQQPPATTNKRVTPKPPPPRIVTISDDFSGNQIDGTIWYQIYQGTGWQLSQQNGHLEFTFPPGTTPGGQWNIYGGHVGTLCKFPGDFDARVDYTLVQWPASNWIDVSLWSFFQPNNEGWEAVRQSSPQSGEQYSGYIGPGHGGSVSLDDMSGTLRLTRRHGLVTAYFLHNGKWLSFGSAYNAHTTAIAVGAGSEQNPPVRSDQVVVDFDNFTITAADPICPLGAQGSS